MFKHKTSTGLRGEFLLPTWGAPPAFVGNSSYLRGEPQNFHMEVLISDIRMKRAHFCTSEHEISPDHRGVSKNYLACSPLLMSIMLRVRKIIEL